MKFGFMGLYFAGDALLVALGVPMEQVTIFRREANQSYDIPFSFAAMYSYLIFPQSA